MGDRHHRTLKYLEVPTTYVLSKNKKIIIINCSSENSHFYSRGNGSILHRHVNLMTSGAEVIKLFSCSTQLSMKFKMLVNIEITKTDGIFVSFKV